MERRSNATAIAAAAVVVSALAACGPMGQTGPAAAGVGGSEPKTGQTADFSDISGLCGEKDVSAAMLVISGNNSARKAGKAEFEAEAAKCPTITETSYVDAQGDPQKMRSSIDDLVARGVDIIVAQDLGPSDLPAVKRAASAGVAVVPFIADPGGDPGNDYAAYVAEDVAAYGRNLTDWIAGTLGNEGNLLVLGGPAGNSYSQAVFDAAKETVARYPDMTLLNSQYVVTDWEVGKTQQAVAGALSKYPQIDGVVSDYGGGSVGGIRAFLAAKRPLPAWAANDTNEFSCTWTKYNAEQPDFEIATQSIRQWMVRPALRHAMAAAQGLENLEPTIFELPLFEDSVAGGDLAPKCDPSLPPDAIVSSQLTREELLALFR